MTAPATTIDRAGHATVLDRVPAASLVLIAILGFQLGAVVAKPAIEDGGPIHAAFLRSILGGAMLLAWKRPAWPLSKYQLKLAALVGLLMVINSIAMYGALERIPVGIAIAIGFWGPMVVALHGSRRPIDYLWVCLAISGILLFTPLADSSFDITGVLLAVLAGAGFGGTLVFMSKFGHSVGGVTAAGIALAVGAIALAPISIGTGLADAIRPEFFLRMVGAAVLMSIFGNAIETTALTRVKPSLYAVLISTEPAVGAILGFIILSEHIGWLGAAGIGAVATASIGASLTHGR